MQKTGRRASLFEGLPPACWLLWAGTLINRRGGFVPPFLTLYLTGQVAFMVSLLGAGWSVSQLTGGMLSDRLGRRPIMMMNFFATLVTTFIFGLIVRFGLRETPPLGGWIYQQFGSHVL